MIFDKISNRYAHLIYERTDTGLHLTLEEYRKFLDDAVKFDENGEVVSEQVSPLFDIPEEAIQCLLMNASKKVDGSWLKESLKSSRHWRNMKNVDFGEVFFSVFDFSSADDIDVFNSSIGFSLNELEHAKHLFFERVGRDFGFYSHVDRCHVICVNLKAGDIRQVMLHELSHLLQTICGVRLVDGVKQENIKNVYILKSEFGVTYDLVLSYFSKYEFAPHVDGITSDLKRLRSTFYGELDGIQFRQKVFSFLNSKTMREAEAHELYQSLSKSNNGDVSSLMMMLFSRISGYKFQKILGCIRTVFV